MMSTLIPVYYQIKQAIKNQIIDKEYLPGEKIPTENQLAEQFKVTRLTVRQAISLLNQEGLLVSKRGHGTFVTENENLVNSLSLESAGFIDDNFYHVQKTKTRFAEINKIAPSKVIASKLGLNGENISVVQLKRVRFLNDNPFSFITNYLPVEIGSQINEDALYKKSLLEILVNDIGIFFKESFQTIEASFADQEVAEKLGVPSGAPMLAVERIMYAKKQKPVLLSHLLYRGDLFKYIARFKNVKRNNKYVWIRSSL